MQQTDLEQLQEILTNTVSQIANIAEKSKFPIRVLEAKRQIESIQKNPKFLPSTNFSGVQNERVVIPATPRKPYERKAKAVEVIKETVLIANSQNTPD